MAMKRGADGEEHANGDEASTETSGAAFTKERSGDAEVKSAKRARRTKHQTAEEAAAMAMKKRIETAARERNGAAALAAFQELQASQQPIPMYIRRVAINALASAEETTPASQEAALQMFREGGDDARDESVYSALLKLCSRVRAYDRCLELLNEMQREHVEPKLRTFGPLLQAYSNDGDLQQALWVHERLHEHELELTEVEFVALLRVCAKAGDREHFYRVLDEFVDVIPRPGLLGADMLREWFASDAAREDGREWTYSETQIDAQGVCQACKTQLQSLELAPGDNQHLLDKIEGLVRIDEPRIKQWDAFKQWLAEHGPFDVVIDAANVGFFNQNYDGGGFSYEQIEHMVTHYQALGRRVLVVLHARRTRDDQVPETHRATLANWKAQHVMYNCAKGNNDDWYWLYAAVRMGKQALVVTNDEMRDHHFQMIHNRAFARWKARHQVHYRILGASRLQVQEPACYSASAQQQQHSSSNIDHLHEEAPSAAKTRKLTTWHVPVQVAHEELQWRCWALE